MLSELPEPATLARLQRMKHLATEFLPLAVGLLDSEDPLIADSARALLLSELHGWRDLDDATAERSLKALIDTIVDQVDGFRTGGKRSASEIVATILNWPLPRSGDSLPILEQCHRALERTRYAWTGPRSYVETSARNEAAFSSLVSPQEMVARLPGGGVPAAPSELPEDARSLDALPDTGDFKKREREAGEPRLFEPPSTVVAPQPNLLPGGPTRRLNPPKPVPRKGQPKTIARDPLTISSKSPSIALIQLLRDGDPTTRRKAEKLLRDRGFTSVQLKLARQLFSPDARRRKELAQRLPSLPGIQPEPWLRLLARDSDAEVRLTAISILGTSPRRDLIEEFRRLEQNERDPRVLDHIRQALKQRAPQR